MLGVLDCHHFNHPCVLLILILDLGRHSEVATIGRALVNFLVREIQFKFWRCLLRFLLNFLKVEKFTGNWWVSIESKMFRNEIVITLWVQFSIVLDAAEFLESQQLLLWLFNNTIQLWTLLLLWSAPCFAESFQCYLTVTLLHWPPWIKISSSNGSHEPIPGVLVCCHWLTILPDLLHFLFDILLFFLSEVPQLSFHGLHHGEIRLHVILEEWVSLIQETHADTLLLRFHTCWVVQLEMLCGLLYDVFFCLCLDLPHLKLRLLDLVIGPSILGGVLQSLFEISRPILVWLNEHLFDCFLELLEG